MRRVKLVRQSRWFQKGKHTPREQKAKRQAHFDAARLSHGFGDPSIQQYAVRLRLKGDPVSRKKESKVPKQEKTWIGEHLDVHVVQKLATRAYRASSKVLYGKAKKVRFKGKNQLDTVEGKNNESGIKWRNGSLVWGNLTVPGIIDEDDPVIAHGLKRKVKFVRLVRRKIKGQDRFYAQLVVEGEPYQKPEYQHFPKETVGADLGPSTIAVVGADEANLLVVSGGVKRDRKKIRRLQRRIDRQRRANNPDNFNSDGTVKRGIELIWSKSTRQQKTEMELAELYRREAEYRKSQIGFLVHSILRMGIFIQLEKVSYKAWQRVWGRSIALRAPGMLVSHLRRKAESAGGKVVEFPTRGTKLSQTCHCGRVHQKTLRERWHECECGVSAQRDLYSAYLARFVEENRLNADKANESWQGAELLLQAAFNRANQSASQQGYVPASFGRKPGVRADRLQKMG